MRYLEDISPGDRFESRSHHLDAGEIGAFARQFDPQPFHLDEEGAQETFFGRQVASGWHTAAITMRLLVDEGPFAGGIVGVSGEISWPRPTLPGDILRVHAEIVEVVPSRSRPDRGMVTVRAETRNDRGQVVQVLTTRLVVPRRSGGTGTTVG